jgi:hypothetical protein
MRLFLITTGLWSFIAIAPPAPRSSEKTMVDGSIVLKGKALEDYYAFYQQPVVLAVRSDLDRYLKNEGKDWGGGSGVIQGLQKDKSDGLANFDKKYYQSKFFVVEIEPFMGGGETVSLVFQDRPDKMFDVWMYHLKEGDYEMRAFVWDKSVSAKEIATKYKYFIEDKVHAL